MATTTLQIDGLGATAATAHIEKALESVPKVSSVKVESGQGRVHIDHEGADEAKLMAALQALGYDQVKRA